MLKHTDQFAIDKSTITLYNDDAFKVMLDLVPETVDAVVCDPPYGISFNATKSTTKWDDFTDEEYKKFMYWFLQNSKRVLKPGGSLWMFCAPTQIRTIFAAYDAIPEMNRLDLNLENWCVIARNKGRGSTKKMKSLREDVLHFSKGKYKWHPTEYWRKCVTPYMVDGKPRGWVVDQETGQPMRWSGVGNVLFYSFPYYLNKFEKQIHSTQKPVLSLCNFIMSTTDVGGLVMDPFAGSMSCGVASVLSDRNFIGVEREKEMYEKGKAWLKNIDFDEASNYVKGRLSSGEKGFKFGFGSRTYQKK